MALTTPELVRGQNTAKQITRITSTTHEIIRNFCFNRPITSPNKPPFVVDGAALFATLTVYLAVNLDGRILLMAQDENGNAFIGRGARM